MSNTRSDPGEVEYGWDGMGLQHSYVYISITLRRAVLLRESHEFMYGCENGLGAFVWHQLSPTPTAHNHNTPTTSSGLATSSHLDSLQSFLHPNTVAVRGMPPFTFHRTLTLPLALIPDLQGGVPAQERSHARPTGVGAPYRQYRQL